MFHIESLFRTFGRAFSCLRCSPGKWDLMASAKQHMPSIYTRPIPFTTEVVGYLLFWEREDRGSGSPIAGRNYLTAQL